MPTEQRRNILFSNKHDELSTGIIVIGHLGTAQLFATTSLGHAGSFHRAHSSHTYSCDVIIDFRVRAQFRRCAFCSVFFCCLGYFDILRAFEDFRSRKTVACSELAPRFFLMSHSRLSERRLRLWRAQKQRLAAFWARVCFDSGWATKNYSALSNGSAFDYFRRAETHRKRKQNAWNLLFDHCVLSNEKKKSFVTFDKRASERRVFKAVMSGECGHTGLLQKHLKK